MGPGWSREEKSIISRRLGGGPLPAYEEEVIPPPARAGGAAPAPRREAHGRVRWPTPQIAALAVAGRALLAFLAGALTSGGPSDTSAPRVATRRPPVAPAPPGPAPMRSEREQPSPRPPAGEAVVRAFYDALGRGDGETASALVVAEKRSSRAYSPQAISRFYGGLPEPLRLTAITPLPGGSYRVGYRYSAGRSRCDGEAVVSLASRDGRDLIRSIRALNGC